MDIYQNKPALNLKIFQDRNEKFNPAEVIAKKLDSAKTTIPTEKGNLTRTAIRKRIVELGPDAVSKTCLNVAIELHRVPLIKEVFQQMVIDEFYPNVKSKMLNPERAKEWEAFILNDVTGPLMRQLNGVADSKSKEKKTLLEYTNCIPRLFAGCFYAPNDDRSHYIHIMDERYEKDKERLGAIRSLAIMGNEWAAQCAIQGIVNAFKTIDNLGSFYLDVIGIIDWYIEVGKIFSYYRVAEAFAKILHACSKKGEKEKKICIAVFEDNQAALEKIYRSNKHLDFVDRGRYEEYESTEKIAGAAGFDIEEFFAEKTERETAKTTGTAKPKGKRDSISKEEYGIEILNDIDELYGLLQPLSSSIKLFNIKPNEVKKKKATVFGKYVAVAAKIDEEWIILVDSIQPGNAIYCWKGEKYLEGLEKFKQNKAYAREQEDIDHKNHRFDKITVEIYRQLLADKGISL